MVLYLPEHGKGDQNQEEADDELDMVPFSMNLFLHEKTPLDGRMG